jgi:signal recognition particle subunit SRP14
MPSTSTSESTETDPSILVRASNGKHKSFKKKLSTIVAAGDVDAFYARYAEICKSGMTAMKKRDRSAKKKGKGKKEKKAA